MWHSCGQSRILIVVLSSPSNRHYHFEDRTTSVCKRHYFVPHASFQFVKSSIYSRWKTSNEFLGLLIEWVTWLTGCTRALSPFPVVYRAAGQAAGRKLSHLSRKFSSQTSHTRNPSYYSWIRASFLCETFVLVVSQKFSPSRISLIHRPSKGEEGLGTRLGDTLSLPLKFYHVQI